MRPSAGQTVLVVDDECIVRGLIADCLAFTGFQILKACSGLAALDLARQHDGPIHLLVADVSMPGMSGPELATILTAERPEMKVLIVSGWASSRSFDLQSSWAFLAKPFQVTALLAAVQSLLTP